MLNKLRSGRGASITFALLLFLVCAVLSSLIVTAASAAAGRIANMAEADQRYYSVTSACDLFKSLIDGKTVTIAKEKTKGSNSTTTVYLLPDEGAIQALKDYKSGETINNTSYTSADLTKVAAWKYYWTKEDPDNPKINNKNDKGDIIPYVISISNSKDDINGISCTANEVITENGDIVITVYKAKDNRPFAMKMTFSADVQEAVFDTEEKTVETTTMKWTLINTEIISATISA